MTNLSSSANAIGLIVKGGQITGRRVALCDVLPPNYVPTTVPVIINWSDYINAAGSAAPRAPISINLQSGVANPISQIRSVKINNVDVGSACIVVFPDTGDQVVCAPDSSVFVNVFTGQLNALVLMDQVTANIGTQTTIYFNNFHLDPAEIADTQFVQNQEIATGQPNAIGVKGPRALGDQSPDVAVLDLTLTGAASQVSIFAPTLGYNVVTLGECHFSVIGCYVDAVAPVAMNATIVDNTGATFLTFRWLARNDLLDYSYKRVYDVVNMQKKFNAQISAITTRSYFLQNNVALRGSGLLQIPHTKSTGVNF